MIITGWSIDGFGLLRDVEVKDLSPKLTIFLGPNEAGKSTLLDFNRGMLFGITGKENKREPIYGGRHGGRLVVEEAGECYVIRREFGGKGTFQIQLPDGQIGSQADLNRLVGSCDKQVYHSVFAFSLTELNSFGDLKKNGMSERLFSAGIVGAGKSARDVMKDLGIRQAKLLKSTATAQAQINKLIDEASRVQSQLVAARQNAHKYGEISARDLALGLAVDELKQQIDIDRQAGMRAQTLHDLWPVWSRRADALRELSTLPLIMSFPSNPESRLTQVRADLQSALMTQRETEEISAGQFRRRALLQPREDLTRLNPKVTELQKDLELYRVNLKKEPVVESTVKLHTEKLTKELLDLGPSWDRTRLTAFDTSIPQLEIVRTWESNASKAEEIVISSAVAARRAALDVEQIQRQVAIRQDTLDRTDVPPDTVTITRNESNAGRLRAALADHATAQVEHSSARKLLEALSEGMHEHSLHSQREIPGLAIALTGLMFAAGAVVAVWFLMSDRQDAGVAAGAVALLALALLAGLALAKRHFANLSTESKRAMGIAKRRLEDADRDYELANSRLLGSQESVTMLSSALGLSAIATTQEVEAIFARLAEHRRNREHYDHLTNELHELEQRQAESRIIAHASTETWEVALAAQTLETTRWNSWKEQLDLPSELSPRGVIDFFGLVRITRETMGTLNAAEQDQALLKQDLLIFVSRAQRVVGELGESDRLSGFSLIARIEKLAEQCQHNRDQQKEFEQLEIAMSDQDVRVARAKAAVQEARVAHAALLEEAQAPDEIQFNQLFAIFTQRQELERAINDADRQMTDRLGDGEHAIEMRAELELGLLSNWESEIQAKREMVEHLNGERDQTIASKRDAERERRDIEESSNIVAFEHHLSSLKEELSASLRIWQVARLAEQLIQETLAKFERERQPKVLAFASERFDHVTRSQYTRLYQQNEDLCIELANGKTIMPEALSRGTAEQLYLCLRFGLAGDFASRGQSLPLVMDDVLVNFDPERARAIAEVICSIAQTQQVILFTCHPATARLFESLEPDCRCVEMPRFGLPSNNQRLIA